MLRETLLVAVAWTTRSLRIPPRVRTVMGASYSGADGDVSSALRGVGSDALLREVARRGLDASDAPGGGGDGDAQRAAKRPRQSHVVGELRPEGADSGARSAELGAALSAVGCDVADLCAGPPLKAYNTYVRPRDKGDGGQTAANAAHQIAFLQRHELARRVRYRDRSPPRLLSLSRHARESVGGARAERGLGGQGPRGRGPRAAQRHDRPG